MMKNLSSVTPLAAAFLSRLSHALENKAGPVAAAHGTPDGPRVQKQIGSIEVLNPAFDLKKVRVILWDMDGTMYSQAPMLQQFRADFREKFPDVLKPVYDAKSEEVVRGTSLFRVGHSYDPRHKLILRKDHKGNVRGAYELSGRPVSDARVKQLYPTPLRGDEGIIHIDNKVKALEVLGVSLGKTMEEADQAYFETRGKYFQNLNGESPTPGFAEFLMRLREKGHVHLVTTAAPLEGAQKMLNYLNVLGHLHKIHTGISKPMGMEALIKVVTQEHNVRPDEILCIGNEAGMDLLVPHRMGAQTLLIEEDPGQNLEGADARVRSMKDLIDCLVHFNHHGAGGASSRSQAA